MSRLLFRSISGSVWRGALLTALATGVPQTTTAQSQEPVRPDQLVVSAPVEGPARIPVLIEPGVESASFTVDCVADWLVLPPDEAALQPAAQSRHLVSRPSPGEWRIQVSRASRGCRVEAAVKNNRLHVSAGLAQSRIPRGGCFLVSANASASRPIAGCRAVVRLEGLNAPARDTPLADEGGLYRTRLCGLGPGRHEFQVSVQCREGEAHIRNEGPPGIGSFPAAPPLSSFERIVRFTGVVE